MPSSSESPYLRSNLWTWNLPTNIDYLTWLLQEAVETNKFYYLLYGHDNFSGTSRIYVFIGSVSKLVIIDMFNYPQKAFKKFNKPSQG